MARRWRAQGYASKPKPLAPIRVAVLGRTMSSLFFASELRTAMRELGQALEVSLFPAMFDPARNIYTPHPICEYASNLFVADCGGAKEAASLEEKFAKEYLEDWLKKGDLEEVPGRPSKTYAAMNGGWFQLIMNLEKQLLESQDESFSAVLHDEFQLTQMWHDDQSGRWTLYSEFVNHGGRDWYAAHQVPPGVEFDAVIMGYDTNPRGARKASYKQLLESALPTTCGVIRSLAKTVSASAMACVVELDTGNPNLDRRCDLPQQWGQLQHPAHPDKSLEGEAGILELAERLDMERHAVGRGLKFRGKEIWTLIANVDWSHRTRSSFRGGWDKKKVEREIVEAFRKEMCSTAKVETARGVVPCFHWQNAWPMTALPESSLQCIYDAACRLGWASDACCAGHRSLRQGNLLRSFKSATDLVQLLVKDFSGKPDSRLPSPSEWYLRGSAKTGRDEPEDGLDHTWSTAVRLAQDEKLILDEADSLKKYRKR